MWSVIVWVLVHLVGPTEGSERLRTMPSTQHLTEQLAAEHWWAAEIAATITGECLGILLAIAWHESNFHSNYVQPEPGHRFSCGVGTPEPLPSCHDEELVVQYERIAEHVQLWRSHLGGRALYGYAGGRTLSEACARDRTSYPQCSFPGQMMTISKRLDPASLP